MRTVDRVGSTNSELLAIAARGAEWAPVPVLVARHQHAGRGRGGRRWIAPLGQSLTASVLLRPSAPRESWPGLTALGAIAAVQALAGLGVTGAAMKWPNDVVVASAGPPEPGWGNLRKAGGLLAEVGPSPSGDVVVLGLGLNIGQAADALPVEWATSLRVLGVDAAPREVLDAWGAELLPLIERWEASGGDLASSGLLRRLRDLTATLGAPVEVARPDGRVVRGVARDLDPSGRLVVETGSGPEVIDAGDVRHVRRPDVRDVQH